MKLMQRLWTGTFLAAVGLLCAAELVASPPLPLETKQDALRFNRLPFTGVPISSEAGNPVGSDGLAPSVNVPNGSGTQNPPTPGQFRTGFFMGGGASAWDWRTRENSPLLKGQNTLAEALPQMQIPAARQGSTLTFGLRSVRMGMPYLPRSVSLAFGSVIEPPSVDEAGRDITQVRFQYWLPEPYTTNGHANAGYYWSPHARKVYAIQPGPITVTWRKAAAYTAANFPASYVNPGGGPASARDGANTYLLFTEPHLVSGSPAKPTRTLYWTEREFRTLGKPVTIPSSKVGAVNIVFSSIFPRTVDEEYRGPGYTSPSEGNSGAGLQELRTLWYDQSQGFMFAYNHEGRVFVEFLGDLRADGETRVPLGYEIVDVVKQPSPQDVDCDLGERLVPPNGVALDGLQPEEIASVAAMPFTYKHFASGSSVAQLFATRATAAPNDCLVHWFETGIEDILWPKVLGRYRLQWPADESRYSHYVRPETFTDEEALATAVQLSQRNVPVIAHQDALDQPRAKVTPDARFYTRLDTDHPAHRTLLRFTVNDQIAFERVFSWLDSAVRDRAFAGTIATNLTAVYNHVNHDALVVEHAEEVARLQAVYQAQLKEYQVYLAAIAAYQAWTVTPVGPEPIVPPFTSEPQPPVLPVAPSNALWSDESVAPRVYRGQAVVGQRLAPPTGEPGATGLHAAGHVHIPEGDLFQPDAYIDPLAKGFAAAAQGAIIPVNVLPGRDSLEVWWFRTNRPSAGYNAGNAKIGLSGIQWPAYIARYSLQWPTDGREIVLASRLGSGTLSKEEAAGRIYSQNQRELPGYNPNEEHALMSGGTAFATRDDLNITTGDEPSSEPFVLLSYKATDGRPAMSVFKVLREKPEAGYVFDYVTSAGTLLQPPPPLGFLRKPTEGEGMYAVNYNVEVPHEGADLPGGWSDDAASGPFGHYSSFTWQDRKQERWVYRGPHAGIPVLEAGTYNPATQSFGPLPDARAVVGEEFAYTIHASRQDEHLSLLLPSNAPAWLRAEGLTLMGKPLPSHVGSTAVTAVIVDLYDGTRVTNRFNLSVVGSANFAMPATTFGGAFTVEGWVYPRTHARWHRILDIGNGPRSDNIVLAASQGYNGRPVFDVYSGGSLVLNLVSPLPIPLNAWTHVAGVVGPDRSARLYVNGKVVASGTATSLPAVMSRTKAYLGKSNWADALLDGILGEVRIWNVARTEAEIQAAMAIGSITEPTTGLYAAYPFGATGADSLQDISGNNLGLTQAGNLASTPITQGPAILNSTNEYTGSIVTFTTRPPYLAASPTPQNSFTMRFYYKTEESFDWPGIANAPPAGTIVPYLRPIDPDTGEFVGDPTSKDTASLEVVYRPVWPVRDPKDSSKALPSLPFGATLTRPAYNLPGIRDMRTARLLYQQSVAQDVSDPVVSAVLHDATRAKFSDLEAAELDQLPDSVRSELFRGLYYFPGLPPHLGKRVFFEPNRGSKGTLVLKGQFFLEALGENYTLLNVLRGTDLQAVLDLCPTSDPDKSKWDGLVNALATDVETFVENPDVAGTYIPDPDQTVTVGVEDLAEVTSDDTAVDSYALSATGPGSGYVTVIEGNGWAFTNPGDPVSMHVFKVGGALYTGEVKVMPAENPLSELVSFQHTADLAGRADEFEYEWKIAAPVNGAPPLSDATMSAYQALDQGLGLPRKTLGGAGIQALTDNYVVMRYRPKSPGHPLLNQWSDWTEPRLAEGWIKRVLAGINPFGQRLTDLYNNAVNTDVSMLTQAGRRWEGDVALNMDTINNYGLIEIYETVLRRGRMLSIEAGFNYGPANDALLLAAGYLNDLYMILGGEAWADASNPTIGIGTKDKTYGDVATSLFSFKGQVATLAEEELALLRGRDNFLLPGVRVAPVYNRLVWNYTRGINSGEVIYALNYNVQEDPNRTPDGVINAADAAVMYPQGHGDAYGHYLTAIKGYYSLLLNSNFDWVPRIEAVNVLGTPVAVDYQDERKFAAAAAAIARTGQQVLDLTWRGAYNPGAMGWAHLGTTRTNSQDRYATPAGTNDTVRFWGMDHWASRVAHGSYIHWVVGNAIVPILDRIDREGIEKVDRTTVPELTEIASIGRALQSSLDNAEGSLSPLGLPEGGIAFDIDPNPIVGGKSGTHFEQVYERAKVALNNAVASFNDAKDVTRLMRSEEDSLADTRAAVARQEAAYRNALIELYGTPFPEDIGPGKTWAQGYEGPDLVHYTYIDIPESTFDGTIELDEDNSMMISLQQAEKEWITAAEWDPGTLRAVNMLNDTNYFKFNWGAHGFFNKPESWTGRRRSPGKIQQSISELVRAHNNILSSLRDAEGAQQEFRSAVVMHKASVALSKEIRDMNLGLNVADDILQWASAMDEVYGEFASMAEEAAEEASEAAEEAVPVNVILGLASGGDVTSPVRSALKFIGATVRFGLRSASGVRLALLKAFEAATASTRMWTEFAIGDKELAAEERGSLVELALSIDALEDHFFAINNRLREYDDALRRYEALRAEGDRIQDERLSFRQRSAQVVQGFRTRDAAFRLFRDEKLERYKTLFDMAARYSLMSANAYDYETGLLGTRQGKDFRRRIVDARALGVVRNGEPQFAGSNMGDPGLSSILAEMKADWDVLRGRLGFNNPDAYGTTVSFRTANLRILPTSDGDSNWKDALEAARVKNLLEDPDVRRHCMQIDDGSGLPVPGIVLTFETTVANGYNVFGRELAAGDPFFNPASFATKIFGVGVALVGYKGMSDPGANAGSSGGGSPTDPGSWFLDPLALSATPYVYLVPVGVDSMRSPPLGDSTQIRSWSVDDVAIPMPFDIGGSGYSGQNLKASENSLTEPLFAVRKHQSFRPVSSPALFSPSLYGSSGSLMRSQFTNNRLVGRSAWNSKWKLVIPGRNLLNNPNEGLDRFIQTVKDVQLHFVTYSYSGN
ncbi:MAG: LamG domain-containing protein [Verrucomicrobiota bacterium]